MISFAFKFNQSKVQLGKVLLGKSYNILKSNQNQQLQIFLKAHSPSMEAQQDFTKLLQVLQRPINCLTDDDRNTRKNGLNTIYLEMDKIEVGNLVRLFTETNLQQYIVKRTLWDKIQNIRQLTLKLISKFTSKVRVDLIKNDQLKPFIQELVKRVNNTPFPQTSQDLRLQTVKLLEKMVHSYPDAFIWYLPQLANALSKTLLDPFAQIKHASNSLINIVSDKFKDNIGQHSINIVKSLSLNLSHQHSKVRKGTLFTAGKILITRNAGNYFEHVQVTIKASFSDKSAEVRKQALTCIARLLKGFGPKFMKMYEPALVSYILSGLSDQNQENVKQAIKQLQQCGQAIKEMEGTQNETQMQPQTP